MEAQQPSPRNLWPLQQKQSEAANLALLEPRPKVAILAPALRHGQRVMKKASPTSGLDPRPDGPSQGSLEVSTSHFETSGTASPLELKALP